MFFDQIKKLIKSHKNKYLALFLLVLLESFFVLAFPFLIAQLTAVLSTDDSAYITNEISIFVLLLGILVLQAGVRYLYSYRVNTLGATILKQLSCRVYEHIQKLPVSYFETKKNGRVLSHISNDVNMLSYFLSGILLSLVPSLLIAVGALFMMFNIEAWFTVVIATCIPLFYIAVKIIGKKVSPLSSLVTEQQAKLVAFTAENIHQIKTIKSLGREHQNNQKFEEHSHALLTLRKQLFHLQALLSPSIQLFSSLSISLVIIICTFKFKNEQMTLANLIAFLMYGFLFTKPMSNFASLYGQFQQAKGASNRLIRLFEEPTEDMREDLPPLIIDSGTIEIKQLSFHYSNAKPLFSNLSITLKANVVNAIVGNNGSGKTTLLNLMMGFLTPQAGSIFIDNQNIADHNVMSLRDQIALVSPDTSLLFGTIYNNLVFAKPNASMDEIETAVKQAGADKFIADLEKGYDSHVGDNGILLSAGQRQKILLARAFLKKSSIIIFDEPTSYADKQSQKDFKFLLDYQLTDHTVIVVTHDESLASIAEHILHVDNGSVSAINKV